MLSGTVFLCEAVILLLFLMYKGKKDKKELNRINIKSKIGLKLSKREVINRDIFASVMDWKAGLSDFIHTGKVFFISRDETLNRYYGWKTDNKVKIKTEDDFWEAYEEVKQQFERGTFYGIIKIFVNTGAVACGDVVFHLSGNKFRVDLMKNEYSAQIIKKLAFNYRLPQHVISHRVGDTDKLADPRFEKLRSLWSDAAELSDRTSLFISAKQADEFCDFVDIICGEDF